MSQDVVERVLGRLVTDTSFRIRFFAKREVELEHLDLVEHEREALRQLNRDAVALLFELLAERLDPRIRRG
jgi:hypothetical protein